MSHPSTTSQRTVLIGGASGFWGDSQIAVPQLLAQPGLQYLVFDYLAETTMSILQRARLRAPELGDDVSFGISPRRPELKHEINTALERIKRNGTYDRINSRFLPFRVS